MGGKALASVSAFSFMLNLFFGESRLSLDLLVPLLVYWLYLMGTGKRPGPWVLVRDLGLIFLAGTAGWLLGVMV
ncbi:hypothetical protein CL1_0892 [Thermococcus cleftensis]|uniref:Uncharacterized protein n=1 Tax=Thermococcus cleftensis (strain DSM 27260 / KACC 17922 / CL1) TaxID=163003 RepID=I3ZTR3_THECF|nr:MULTISPECIES: hypothetical protein [Thermococcus]AFL95097.1 hypothetical protein CL1_0892 [Thermococcus cleftensis]NJE03901.1 hypothetical protein [Thermococcus sp. MV11]